MQVWPVDAAQLPQWLRQRLAQAGLAATPEAIDLLVARTEGNLLAAVQEIEKLKLLVEGNQLDAATVQASVADSARFELFGLLDAALAGEAAHALRMLAGLAQQHGQGLPLERLIAQARPPIFGKRQGLVGRAVQRHPASRWA